MYELKDLIAAGFCPHAKLVRVRLNPDDPEYRAKYGIHTLRCTVRGKHEKHKHPSGEEW